MLGPRWVHRGIDDATNISEEVHEDDWDEVVIGLNLERRFANREEYDSIYEI